MPLPPKRGIPEGGAGCPSGHVRICAGGAEQPAFLPQYWFRAAGHPEPRPRFIGFDNYVYSLEAAASGQGIALGWRRFVDRHLESGALVALGDRYVERDNHFCGMLTDQGRLRPIAGKYLSLLNRLLSASEA